MNRNLDMSLTPKSKCCDAPIKQILSGSENERWNCSKCDEPVPSPAEPVSPLPAQEEEKLKHGAKLFVDQYGETMKKLAEDDAQEDSIDLMVRDFTTAIPKAKSEVRRRIEAALTHASKLAREEECKRIREIVEMLCHEDCCGNHLACHAASLRKDILSSLTPDT